MVFIDKVESDIPPQLAMTGDWVINSSMHSCTHPSHIRPLGCASRFPIVGTRDIEVRHEEQMCNQLTESMAVAVLEVCAKPVGAALEPALRVTEGGYVSKRREH